jgi:hypothetical protein
MEWFLRSTLAAWGACDKAICEASVAHLCLKACTQAMGGSFSLGTVLEALARGEGFGARSVEPWEGWVDTTLAGTLANNLNNHRVRDEPIGL